MTSTSNIGKTCKVEECSTPAWAKSLCITHYGRLRRTGTLKKNKEYTFGDARKYFEKSILLETDNCIIWKYFKAPSGHGQITVNDKRRPVHAFALERKIGKHPEGKPYALHKPIICHNPSCFNYRHLYWGDQKDNMGDAYIDGTTTRGERSSFAKLKEEQVINILKDSRLHRIIAQDYNVSRATIGDIKNRKSWKHLSQMPLIT